MNVITFRKKNSQAIPSTFQEEIPQGVAAIGIDLGTTHSVVSLYSPGKEHPFSLHYDGSPLIPSMFFHENDHVFVGKEAKEQILTQNENIIKGTKRFMGTTLKNFQSGKHKYNPEEAATIIFKKIISHETLQEEIKKKGNLWAVVTVPAHFDDAARQATVQAAHEAGIKILRIINEPTAAALAYSLLPDLGEKKSKEILAVFDYGGGTFDVSIVEREDTIFNVLSSDGDIYLGGDDIDALLADHFLDHITPKALARKVKKDSLLWRKLQHYAEQAKIALQSQGSYLIQDPQLDTFAQIDYTLTRDDFQNLIAPQIMRTIQLTENALHGARKTPRQLSRILLVGGSSRLILLPRMLQEYFPEVLIDQRLEPDLAVSWGAALQAAIILNIKPDTILVDVCSHSLSIGVLEHEDNLKENFKTAAQKFGIMNPNVTDNDVQRVLGPRIHEFYQEMQNLLKAARIIPRNSPIPATKSEFFSTIHDHQTSVQVLVLQGEGATVGENRLIGDFLYHLKPPCPKGTQCELQLTYDLNGMIQLFAKQIGVQNEVKALFDSRTGECLGWSNVESETSFFNASSYNTINAEMLNGLVVRMKRFIKDHPENREIPLLCEEYVATLRKAKKNENPLQIDQKLEKLEDQILEIIEDKSL